MATGFTDMWKGNDHGELVCIKAIRGQDMIRLKEVRRVCGSFLFSEVYSAYFIPGLPP
jgi:hypothetical protein